MGFVCDLSIGAQKSATTSRGWPLPGAFLISPTLLVVADLSVGIRSVGEVFSRHDGYGTVFFAAGSRSHERMMLNDIKLVFGILTNRGLDHN